MTHSPNLSKLKKLWTCDEQGPDKPVGIRRAVASFVLIVLTSAGLRSSAFLFVAFKDHYKVSAEDAAWPISLYLTFLNLSGQKV